MSRKIDFSGFGFFLLFAFNGGIFAQFFLLRPFGEGKGKMKVSAKCCDFRKAEMKVLCRLSKPLWPGNQRARFFFFREKYIFRNFPCDAFHFRSKGLGSALASFDAFKRQKAYGEAGG